MTRRPTAVRRVLVCGGGGVLGFAWTVGALTAVSDELGYDGCDFDAVVGTSAGSVLAALLAAGLPVHGIRRHHQGVALATDPLLTWDYDRGTGGSLPPRPGWRPGSPRLLIDGLRHRQQVGPVVALSGLLPLGRGSLEPLRAMVDGLAPAGRRWPDRPRPWIVATDYGTGERVVFGWEAADRPTGHRLARAGGTPAMGAAVAASCAIPGWYAPITIEQHVYIDGGTTSNTSLDLLLDPQLTPRLEQVVVLAPMASVTPDRPRSPAARIERSVRRAITRSLMSDVITLRGRGVDVLLVTPDPADLALIGTNLMNPRRRIAVLDTAAGTAARQVREHYRSPAVRRRAREFGTTEPRRTNPSAGPPRPA